MANITISAGASKRDTTLNDVLHDLYGLRDLLGLATLATEGIRLHTSQPA
jgi:uncharacterized circularly permuted ATP-grasp superfamily protein